MAQTDILTDGDSMTNSTQRGQVGENHEDRCGPLVDICNLVVKLQFLYSEKYKLHCKKK